MLILKVQNKPSSNICFENFFNDSVGWAAMYMLPHLVKHNTYMQSFQYKILNNILSFHSSVCNLYSETPFHIFYECDRVKCLWSDLVQCSPNTLVLPTFNATDCHFWNS